MHSGICYCGGIIKLPSCRRSIKIGEKVIVNKSGHKGKIKEILAGNYVFYYYIVFPEDLDDEFFTGHRYKPYEITPLENS